MCVKIRMIMHSRPGLLHRIRTHAPQHARSFKLWGDGGRERTVALLGQQVQIEDNVVLREVVLLTIFVDDDNAQLTGTLQHLGRP